MNIWIVSWLPFMASPFDKAEGVLIPGVDAEQALENTRTLVRIDRTAMIKVVQANDFYGIRSFAGRVIVR